MPIHHKDKDREPDPPNDKPYRLFGVDEEGETYFYWSNIPGEFAGYFGPNSRPVWGTLTCKNNMRPDNLVFIENMEMIKELESHQIMHPCGRCKREEYRTWKQAKEASKT